MAQEPAAGGDEAPELWPGIDYAFALDGGEPRPDPRLGVAAGRRARTVALMVDHRRSHGPTTDGSRRHWPTAP